MTGGELLAQRKVRAKLWQRCSSCVVYALLVHRHRNTGLEEPWTH
ncbi:Hypothetical protein A7982_05814 [Minicystis rosea]|nr:Hypothetical protein A7982_05814 [Minicystis rosea]